MLLLRWFFLGKFWILIFLRCDSTQQWFTNKALNFARLGSSSVHQLFLIAFTLFSETKVFIHEWISRTMISWASVFRPAISNRCSTFVLIDFVGWLIVQYAHSLRRFYREIVIISWWNGLFLSWVWSACDFSAFSKLKHDII